MRILITGGAGFIGSHLSDKLLKENYDVMIIDDLSTGRMENINHLKSNSNFNFAIETITNETVMDRLVSECDAIFHLAAAVGVDLIVNKPVDVIERNILGTEVVLKIANRYKKKVFLAGSDTFYAGTAVLPTISSTTLTLETPSNLALVSSTMRWASTGVANLFTSSGIAKSRPSMYAQACAAR